MTKLQVGIVGAVAVAGAAGFATQAETNSELRRELAVLREQQPALVALREENRQLANAAAEIDLLRRDDVELKQLAQSVAEAQQVSRENARQAQIRAAQNRRTQLEAQIREKDRLAQLEVERMNKEGNALVQDYKALSAQAKEPSLAADTRAQLEAAKKAKLAEIQAKQREVQEFIKETRRKLMEEAVALRAIAPDASDATSSPQFLSGSGKLELRRSPAASVEGAVKPAPPR